MWVSIGPLRQLGPATYAERVPPGRDRGVGLRHVRCRRFGRAFSALTAAIGSSGTSADERGPARHALDGFLVFKGRGWRRDSSRTVGAKPGGEAHPGTPTSERLVAVTSDEQQIDVWFEKQAPGDLERWRRETERGEAFADLLVSLQLEGIAAVAELDPKSVEPELIPDYVLERLQEYERQGLEEQEIREPELDLVSEPVACRCATSSAEQDLIVDRGEDETAAVGR